MAQTAESTAVDGRELACSVMIVCMIKGVLWSEGFFVAFGKGWL